jgi:hypothetical protein
MSETDGALLLALLTALGTLKLMAVVAVTVVKSRQQDGGRKE